MLLLPGFFVVLFVGLAAPLFVWARWLARQPRVPSVARYAPLVVVAIALFGFGQPTWVLARMPSTVYAAVGEADAPVDAVARDGIDPSQKARLLAEGISSAMNCFAWAVLALLLVALLLLVGTWMWHWRRPKGA